MACTTINAKILLRRDTSTNWSTVNPILGSGEPGFETDTEKLKIGDGVSHWNDLGYIGIADNNLIFSIPSGEPSARLLTEYKENNEIYTVRSVTTAGSIFKLILASFTPTLSAAGLPTNTLNWDIPCTGFRVSVGNPDDFTTKYISDVASTLQTSGTFSALNLFSAGAKSANPAGGVDWNQQFNTDIDGFIRPISTTTIGGTSSATISFYVTPDGTTVYGTTVPLTITWRNATISISTAPKSGESFLRVYTSTTYALSVGNVTNASSYSHSVSAVGGTISNALGNGTFTFDDPIHKNNTGITRTVSTITTFKRPATVTGSYYEVETSAGPASVSATFIYPNFWLLKPPITAPPSAPERTEIVSASLNSTPTGFNTPFVNVLNNEQSFITSQFVDNSSSPNTIIFWFGIRTSAQQPNVFTQGSSTFESTVTPIASSVLLYPTSDPPLSNYIPESYSLYGFTIQPNSTAYVTATYKPPA